MSRNTIALAVILLVFSSCSHTYYVVRHAEKAAAGPNMSSDVPLTEAGQQRAEALKELLKKKNIAYVFSTNTIRTKSTAQPTADYFHVTTEIYGPGPDSAFINLLKSRNKNTLVIGHSNTVNDIVNMLGGAVYVLSDLPDTEYNKLFIVKMKGKKASFTETVIYPNVTITPRF